MSCYKETTIIIQNVVLKIASQKRKQIECRILGFTGRNRGSFRRCSFFRKYKTTFLTQKQTHSRGNAAIALAD